MGYSKIKDRLKDTFLKLRNRRGGYFFLAGIFISILLIITLLLSFFTTKTVTVPTKSKVTFGKVTVDGPVKGSQFIFNKTTYYLPITIEQIPAGEYTLFAHNNGYIDEKVPFTIEPNKTTSVSLKMLPESSDPQITPFIEENEDAVKQSVTANAAIAKRTQQYPFTAYLPVAIGSVLLDYDVNDDGSVKYVVRALHNNSYVRSDYEQRVSEYIRLKGVDPKTINLQWE